MIKTEHSTFCSVFGNGNWKNPVRPEKEVNVVKNGISAWIGVSGAWGATQSRKDAAVSSTPVKVLSRHKGQEQVIWLNRKSMVWRLF